MDPLLKNIIQIGIVSSVNPERCTVKVSFNSRDDSVSPELPVLVRGSLETNDYWMPAVGEQVVCVSLPNGNAKGFVLGSFYSNVDKPILGDSNHRYVHFEDGTMIDYDKSSKTLSIHANGPVKITTNSGVTINGDLIISGKMVAKEIITSGDVNAGGISVQGHIHSDVTPGVGKTGAPVGG